jgi:hypothetical protein
MMSVADVLAGAREYMEKHGWIRDELKNEEGVCSLGALEHYTLGLYNNRYDPERNNLYRKAVLALAKALPRSDYHAASQVIYFNDEVAENKQEVLDAFAKAEKIERAGFDPDA